MATRKSKLSAVIGFGGQVKASFGKSIARTKGKIGALGKEITDSTKKQSGLRREITKLRSAGKNVDHLERQLKDVGRVQKRLIRQQKGYAARLRFSKMALGGLRKVGRAAFRGIVVGATLAVGAIAKLTLATSSYGDTLAKTSARLGVGVAELEELRFAAGLAGVDVTTFDKSFGKTIRAVGEAARLPTGTFGQAFAALGLNAKALKKQRPEEIIRRMADGFKGLKTRTDKVTVATQLYGDRGLKMLNLLEGGASGIDKLTQEMRDLGIGMTEDGTKKSEEFQDQLLRVKTTFSGLARVVGVEVLPVISAAFGDIIEKLKTSKGGAQELGETLRDKIGSFIEGFKGAWPEIKQGARDTLDVLQGIAKVMGFIVDSAQFLGRATGKLAVHGFGDVPGSFPGSDPSRPQRLTQPSTPGGGITLNQTINAAPGMSEEDLARAVARETERNMSTAGGYSQ